MSEKSLAPLSENFDDPQPLPLIVARKWGFSLAYHARSDGYFYAIQDWIKGLTGADKDKVTQVWGQLKKQRSILTQPLPYTAADGKTYQRDFANDIGLYLIAQYLRVTKERVALSQIKQYLADAGVFVDEARRNPGAAADALDEAAYNREYRKLLAEGFTPEEAQQWLDVRGKQKRQRRIVTAIWRERGISKPGDYADLTNQIHKVALGRTATRHKQELEIVDSPRNYVSAADNATIQITEFTSGLLHEHRESFGKPELAEDIDDVQPIIDAARPEIQNVFSKKPRRLAGQSKVDRLR
jgi:hypothetical protein